MKSSAPPLAVWVTVAAACAIWVGGISWILVYFLELPATTGWLIAGTLTFSLAGAMAVMLYEMSHAPDLTDYPDPAEFDGLLPRGTKHTPSAMPVPPAAAPAFRLPGGTF